MNYTKPYWLNATPHFQGEVDARFSSLANQFGYLQQGRSQAGGAALVVYFQGQKVVDIYTGLQDEHQAWQANTLSVCYSTGKGVLATLAHVLVNAGFLSYDQPIADYWPEFAQYHKDHLSLRHLLSHQSGLFDIRSNIAHAREMLDWPHMLEVMAAATPRFQVGRHNAYQALTFGWLVGGALEKATGYSLAQLMQHYLVIPLQLDGAYFGVPASELARVARPLHTTHHHVTSNNTRPSSASSPAKLTVSEQQSTLPTHVQPLSRLPQSTTKSQASWSEKLLEWTGQNPQDFKDAMIPKGMREFSFFSDAGLQAVIPAANGCFTANSLATIYAMLANQGHWNGQQLLNAQTFEALSQIQSHSRDRVMPIPMHWRMGYHRVLTLGKRVKHGFGHIGYNGSGAWCDPERGLSFAYTHNFKVGSITGDYRLWSLSQEALRCADLQLKGRKGWF